MSPRPFPGHEAFDLTYRPGTYWPDLPTEETVLAQVKGTVRRGVARLLLDEPDPTVPDGVGEILLAPDLGESGRDAWGRLHPRNMGGELLPDGLPGEVEIARIELDSVTADVCQVLARRGDDGRIRYRVVDEYWDEGVTYTLSREASDEPLRLGELIELIDTSNRDDDPYADGLVDSHVQSQIDEETWIDSPAEIASFVTVSSAFYPALTGYYAARIDAWLADVEDELEAEAEAEEDKWLVEYRKQLDELVDATRWLGTGDELPEDPEERATVLIVEGHLDQAGRICDEIGRDADELRILIALRRNDIPEAIRLARRVAGE